MMRGFHTGEDNLSNRAATSGGKPSQPGPLLGDAIHAPNSNIIQFPVKVVSSLPDNCGSSSDGSPFLLTFDVREIGALCLVVAVALIPWAVVAGVVFLYLTLVD
jgi:hypothetical protein